MIAYQIVWRSGKPFGQPVLSGDTLLRLLHRGNILACMKRLGMRVRLVRIFP